MRDICIDEESNKGIDKIHVTHFSRQVSHFYAFCMTVHDAQIFLGTDQIDV